ncbi:formylglycine-generating enzyme required for sulfatase activity [Massilia aurea]|uniref:Formylglycine-generating enzyme required for sulfatase activity n=1 Tax=Massilia aurea TaxID=373040 RepID=A0A7W9X1S9_9BURK|nr:SUMF1/EgtB/PvdO family nonheme iron enzyme [Massilia aurea]MBB6134934.1 formylglycine-generating enzyme required for sulfatase activity [Massilia aurea]
MAWMMKKTDVVLVVALLALQAGVQAETKPQENSGIEVLEDGNVRDPAPTSEQIASLVARTKKNMIKLPAGTFDMGDWGPEVNPEGLPFDGYPQSKPLHKVKLNRFSLSKYPVTYGEFDVFSAALRISPVNQNRSYLRTRTANHAAGVTWHGAKEYCQWIGTQAGLAIDLPTEAQWEYAARSGGKRNLFPTDNGKEEQGRNFPSYGQEKEGGGRLPVGQFPPNPAGFYDFGVSGEWVNDWYAADYYTNSPFSNPKGPASGEQRVVRGNLGQLVMNMERSGMEPVERSDTWTLFSDQPRGAEKEVPYTKFSGKRSMAFRCVVN